MGQNVVSRNQSPSYGISTTAILNNEPRRAGETGGALEDPENPNEGGNKNTTHPTSTDARFAADLITGRADVSTENRSVSTPAPCENPYGHRNCTADNGSH
jgi:hypothetical protein